MTTKKNPLFTGGNEAPVSSDRMQPGPGEPDHWLQPQHRHPGHHHPAEDRQREQRGPPHEADLILRFWDLWWVQGDFNKQTHASDAYSIMFQ